MQLFRKNGPRMHIGPWAHSCRNRGREESIRYHVFKTQRCTQKLPFTGLLSIFDTSQATTTEDEVEESIRRIGEAGGSKN